MQGQVITVHSGWESDFSNLGLCPLLPTECKVEEEAGALFQLKMTHPMDAAGRWWNLREWNIIKAPAPVRETPLINLGTSGGSQIREIYKVRVNSSLKLRTKPSTSTGKVIGRYKNGTEVIKIGEDGSWYEVIVRNGGATGWMSSSYLKYVGEETETVVNDKPGNVVEPRQTRDQLFRIVSVEKDDANRCVHVTAQHVFYDLVRRLIKGEYAPEGVTAASAAAAIFGKTYSAHEFSVYSDNFEKISGEYTGRSIASALLETDGIVQQAKARLVRDNFDVFILKDEERDRGVEIRHGKNMLGAVMTVDVSETVTRIIPVGKDKEGEPLYLDGDPFVTAPNADQIPIQSEMRIEYDVRVGKKDGEFATEKAAREELRRLAEEEFEKNGASGATIGLDVDFVVLEKTRQYAPYEALQSVHLYDIVRVVAVRSGINAKLRMTGYVYNCLTRRYEHVTLGELYELMSSVSGYDIAPGSVSGTKIIMGSVDGNRMRDASIGYAKIMAATIERLTADAIVGVTAKIDEITANEIITDDLYAALAKIIELRVKMVDAGSIDTDQLYAGFAHIIELAAGSIAAGSIEADKLAAALAEVVSLHAATGDFDLATIRNLLANALILQQGTAGSMQITNLAVTSANLLSAVIGNLVLRGEDGGYYEITVGSDGTIRAGAVSVTDGEIAAGQTQAGREIVETHANIAQLDAQSIRAASAVLAEIVSESLTAGRITAGEALIASATIPELYVTAIRAMGNSIDISANESIRLLLQTDENIKRWFRFDADGMTTGRPESTYSTRTDDTGFHVQQLGGTIGSFSKRTLAAENIRVGRVDTFEPRFVMREAPDGGLLIVKEGMV